MGVPSFFKWLNFACPGLTVNVKSSWAFRELPPHAPRLTHLYLDLNGILHTCVQALINSSELGASRMTDNLDDLFQKITAYITAVLSVAMPSKLLVMTVDGVAPRAKMHQQRERRHRTAAERAKEDLRLRKTRLMWKRRDLKIPTVYEDMYNKISQNKRNGSAGEVLIDKNAITPGTKFMEQIGFLLRKFVQENLAQGKDGWDKIEVILSDSSVPGEGEHKILDLIRKQRVQEGYDPNHVHCIYGADADLIMLALSTHEPNFYIVREEHRRSNAPVVPLPAPGLGTSTSALEEAIGSIGDNLLQTQEIPAPEFTFIDIGQVRTFLFGFLSAPQSAPPEPRDPQHSGQFCPGDCVQETKPSSSKTKSSSKSPNKPKTSEPQAADPVPQNTHHLQNSHEYIIDEFVFLCFLCGNDFLPSLPSLETYRGGIDILMAMWKSLREKKQFRLVKNGEIDLAALQEFMKHYSQIEEKILKCLEEDAIKWAKWRGAGDKNNMQSYLLLTPEGYRQVADMNLEEVVKEEEEWREREQLDQSEEGDGAKKTDEEAPIGIGAIDSLETLDEMLAGINELKLYDPVKEQKLEKQFKSDMGILNAVV